MKLKFFIFPFLSTLFHVLYAQEVSQIDTIFTHKQALSLINELLIEDNKRLSEVVSNEIKYNWCPINAEEIKCDKKYFLDNYRKYLTKDLMGSLTDANLFDESQTTGFTWDKDSLGMSKGVINEFGELIPSLNYYQKLFIWIMIDEDANEHWFQFNFILVPSKNNIWQLSYFGL